MHFHNGLLILAFICDMSGRVNLVAHATTYFSGKLQIMLKSY